MFSITEFSRRPVLNFISKRSGPFDGSVTLTKDRVYILPTRVGLIFGLLLLVLLIGSINYEKNLGFILTFVLAAVGNILMLACWRNIAGLELKRLTSNPVFCGDNASFDVQLVNTDMLNRYAIAISHQGKEYDVIDCNANSTQQIRFKVSTTTRGTFNPGKFRLYTEFPAGLFVAWTWVDLSMSCLVYPAPDKTPENSTTNFSETGENDKQGSGQEHFSHLRKYHHGDNISHISWKAAAKTDELFSKQFNGASSVIHWIDWDRIPARNKEHRLSIMTAKILSAEKNQQHYGIKLPGKIIKPANGHQHKHHCLSTLALF